MLNTTNGFSKINCGDNTHTSWLPSAPGGAAYPYSLVYIYYEQYDYIRGVALMNIFIALTAVFVACFIVSSFSVALTTVFLVTSILLSVCGWTWALNPHGATLWDAISDPFGDGPYGVDLNAVFVVNLITTVGLGVEFVIHIVSAYRDNILSERERLKRGGGDSAVGGALLSLSVSDGEVASNDIDSSCSRVIKIGSIKWTSPAERNKHLQGALVEMGSSVVTGITFTKLVGVSILALAPSQLFRLYYFRAFQFLSFFRICSFCTKFKP